jgi:hypothetical protein
MGGRECGRTAAVFTRVSYYRRFALLILMVHVMVAFLGGTAS